MLVKTGSILVILLPMFNKYLNYYNLINADTLTSEGREYLTSLLNDDQKECGKRKCNRNRNLLSYMKVYGENVQPPYSLNS